MVYIESCKCRARAAEHSIENNGLRHVSYSCLVLPLTPAPPGVDVLASAEEVPVATYLVEELGADIGIRNNEGQTAEEKIAEEEGETNAVCLYLKGLRERRGAGNENSTVGGDGAAAQEAESVRPPPPLPNGVKINVGTMEEGDVGEAPDPEVRRRIEELAARDDFQTEEGQRQLRKLVTEIVTGMGADEAGRSVRRRVD